MMNKEQFSRLFKVGEVIDSGGPVDHVNHAHLEILSIDDESVHYRSVKGKSIHHFNYFYIDVVLEGFSKIDPKSIQPSIQQVFLDAGLKKNYSTENYAYGFAKEIRSRLTNLAQPILYFGELLDLPSGAEQEEHHDLLTEGTLVRVIVDMRERNAEAVRRCKELHGVQCVCCGFDFEQFYGPIGTGFIHAHHLHPLSNATGAQTIDPAKDLVPICPNCHAMVHRGKVLLSIKKLKSLILRSSM